jgi:hypothetical protein
MNPAHKTIEHWSVKDIALYLEGHRAIPKTTIARLRELHDLTRWIPVSERMPTEEDSYQGRVLWLQEEYSIMVGGYTLPRSFTRATRWQRITPPEGV